MLNGGGGYRPSKDPVNNTPPGQRGYKDTELVALCKELVQRYPDFYKEVDKSFTYWVAECQNYAEWKKTNDWDVITKPWKGK